MGSRLKGAAIVFVVLLLGLAGGWAARRVVAEPAPVAQNDFTTTTTRTGSVERSLALNVAAKWPSLASVGNRATGVVTAVPLLEKDRASAGTVLYRVELRPTVLATGRVPAFRSLSAGAVGPDVSQLQSLLRTLGHLSSDATGRFDSQTYSAVVAWQRDLGIPETGVVEPGDVIFVPRSLPARIEVDRSVVKVGADLTGGEPVVRMLAERPAFTMPVTKDQARTIPTGTEVVITSPQGHRWRAKVTALQGDESQGEETRLGLEAATAGQPICRNQCAEIPVQGTTLMDSRIWLVPKQQGVIVPVAALATRSGESSLIGADGKDMPVTVAAVANGVALVDGVDAGVRVRVPSDAAAS